MENSQFQQPNYYSPQLEKRPKVAIWFWRIFIILVLIGVITFAVAVIDEVNKRDAKMREITGQNQPQSLLDNKLLQELKDSMATSSEATTTVSQTAPITEKSKERLLAETLTSPHLGNVSSSLVIVEFGDFECPVCLEEYPAIRAITNKYPNDVLFIFRNYPIKSDNSSMLAQAGLCANDQNKFWQLHDKLFMNQGKMTNLDDFKKVAISAGVNWPKLEQCLTTEKYRDQVLKDTTDAIDLGAQGTPTFFVNGNRLAGAVTVEVWEQIIAKQKELETKN
jgi:protein-disulfide isomerase